MIIDDTMELCRDEVGTIINNNRDIVLCTNSLEDANRYYEDTIKKFSPPNDINHTILFLYDYDRATNINYYDSTA